MLTSVSNGMGDSVQSSTPIVGKYITSHQVNSASHPSVGRCTEYQPNGGDALQLGNKDRYGS